MEFLNILRFFFGHISFIPIELFLLLFFPFLGGGSKKKRPWGGSNAGLCISLAAYGSLAKPSRLN